MTYELCKQLKDAGFPQKSAQEHPLYIKEYDKEAVQVPTLSELIDACGDDFTNLNRFKEKFQTNRSFPEAPYKTGDWYWFDTPEEAVANLWLELNKK